MAKFRFLALQEIARRKPVECGERPRCSVVFGENVFSMDKMRHYLSIEAYKKLEDAKNQLDHAKAFLTVEMSTGQMVEDVRLVVRDAAPVEFYGRVGGVIPTPAEVLDKIRQINEGLGD